MTASPLGIGPLPQESAPLRRKLAAALRRLIETGVLKAGQRLIEKDLCDELGVSRTVLREALRELESEGLLSAGARGLSVTTLSRADAENLYAVRGALEGLVARQASARADRSDHAAMARALEDLAKAYAGSDLGRLLDTKRAFYEVLCAAARNDIARDLIERLNSRTSLLRARSLSDPARKGISLTEIEAIVAAIVRRDGAEAGRLAERHVSNAAAVAIANLGEQQRSPSGPDDPPLHAVPNPDRESAQ